MVAADAPGRSASGSKDFLEQRCRDKSWPASIFVPLGPREQRRDRPNGSRSAGRSSLPFGASRSRGRCDSDSLDPGSRPPRRDPDPTRSKGRPSPRRTRNRSEDTFPRPDHASRSRHHDVGGGVPSRWAHPSMFILPDAHATTSVSTSTSSWVATGASSRDDGPARTMHQRSNGVVITVVHTAIRTTIA